MATYEPDLEPWSAKAAVRTTTPQRAVTPHPKKNHEGTGFILSRFHQQDGIRHYIFEHPNVGGTSTEFTVDADVRLLRKYGIVLQELPLLCLHLLEKQDTGSASRVVIFSEELMKEQADHRSALKQAAEEKKKAYHGHRPSRVGQAFR